MFFFPRWTKPQNGTAGVGGGVQPESKMCWIPRLKAVWHYAATRNYIFICVRHMNIKIRHLKEKALILAVDQELPWAPCPHIQLLAWYHHFSVPQAMPTWHSPRLIYHLPHLNRLLFLLSYPKEQYQHLPSCKEKQIRRKHTNTISGAMICVVGFYMFFISCLILLCIFQIPFKRLHYKQDTWLYLYCLKNRNKG